MIHYTCIEGFISSTLSSLSATCDGINWMPAQPSGCKGAKSSNETILCIFRETGYLRMQKISKQQHLMLTMQHLNEKNAKSITTNRPFSK